MIKAIIFDFDGVIADSVEVSYEANRIILEKFGSKEGKIKYFKWKNNRKHVPNKLRKYTKQWYIFVYGEKDGPESYEHRKKYKEWIESLDYYQTI